MRRFLATAAVAAAVVLSFGAFATSAFAETDRVTCAGNSGFDTSGSWVFTPYQASYILGHNACQIASPDNNPTLGSTGGQPLLNPGGVTVPTVPNPSGCLGQGVFTVTCLAFDIAFPVLNLVEELSPGGTNLVLGTVFGATNLPVGGFANLSLTGTGNLSCGDGTLTGTGSEGDGPETDFPTINWSATFHNGIGTVTGTAVTDGSPTDDPSDAAGTVKKVAGYIIVGDGAGSSTLPSGVCTSDSNGQDPTAVYLTYS